MNQRRSLLTFFMVPGREALRLLTKHRAGLDALVKALLERESLDEREILQVTGLPTATPLETKNYRSHTTEQSKQRLYASTAAALLSTGNRMPGRLCQS
jgi:hypothetical protein